MKKLIILTLLISFSMMVISVNLFAGEIDVLVDKLVEKEMLTPVEAQIVLDETKYEVSKEIAEKKHPTLPKWVQAIKMSGDLRLRFQSEKKENDDDSDNEGRIRARLGLYAKVAKNFAVAVGIATAGSSNDARSRNVTLNDQFDTFGVEWDYGYVEWTPRSDLKVVGGKFKRKTYLWLPTDMLWDGDITPEGSSFNWNGTLEENIDFWVNGGCWILDENGHADKADPFLNYAQIGVSAKEGKFDVKFANTFYSFQGIEDIDLGNNKVSQGSNNTVTGSTYRSISPAIEVGIIEAFGGLPCKADGRIALFAEYIKNLDNSIIKDELDGWSAGVKFGHKKVKKNGDWQIKYIHTKLRQDAFPDIFPDSDRFSGRTGVKAHEVAFKYGIKENVSLGVDYYRSWEINRSDNKQDLVQVDLVFKF